MSNSIAAIFHSKLIWQTDFVLNISISNAVLFCKRHVNRESIVAVCCRICTRRHQRCVDLVVKVSTERNSLAHHIVCREVHSERARSACGLSAVNVDFSDNVVIVCIREIQVQRQVIIHPLLFFLDFQHAVEIGNFIANSYHKLPLHSLHKLPGR